MGNPKLKISLVLGSDVEDTFTANYLILSAKHIPPPNTHITYNSKQAQALHTSKLSSSLQPVLYTKSTVLKTKDLKTHFTRHRVCFASGNGSPGCFFGFLCFCCPQRGQILVVLCFVFVFTCCIDGKFSVDFGSGFVYAGKI